MRNRVVIVLAVMIVALTAPSQLLARAVTVSLTTSPNPADLGEPVTLHVGAGCSFPVHADIYDGGKWLGRAYTDGTEDNFVVSTLSSGVHSLTAIFYIPYACGHNPPRNQYARASETILGSTGYINPKYAVVDVIYAPPGEESYVDYTNSTTASNTQKVINTYTQADTTSVSVTSPGGLFGFLGGTQTVNQSSTLTQQSQDSTSVTASDTNTNQLTVYGPGADDQCGPLANDFIGIDHDCDTIRV